MLPMWCVALPRQEGVAGSPAAPSLSERSVPTRLALGATQPAAPQTPPAPWWRSRATRYPEAANASTLAWSAALYAIPSPASVLKPLTALSARSRSMTLSRSCTSRGLTAWRASHPFSSQSCKLMVVPPEIHLRARVQRSEEVVPLAQLPGVLGRREHRRIDLAADGALGGR